MRFTLRGNGKRRTYGTSRPASPDRAIAPVVRVLGVEAAFARRSFAQFEQMPLRILADTPSLSLTFLRCGHEVEGTGRNDEMTGLTMGEPVSLDWTGKRSAPVTVRVQPGEWPTGLYAARLETPDGRVGFAPFVLSPKPAALPPGGGDADEHLAGLQLLRRRRGRLGRHWYAGGNPPVVLDRPFLDRGVPPRYRRYDLPFLRWLAINELEPDFLAEDESTCSRRVTSYVPGTTWWSIPGTANTSPSAPTTSSSDIATSAAA